MLREYVINLSLNYNLIGQYCKIKSKIRVTERNKSTKLRRWMLVCLQGTSTGAYRDTCRWM